jgi:hypothetical protein
MKRLAGITGVAGFCFRGWVETIDGFGQNAGSCGFADPARTTEQKGLCQVIVLDGVFERIGNGELPNNRIKGLRAIFARRNNKITHTSKLPLIFQKGLTQRTYF